MGVCAAEAGSWFIPKTSINGLKIYPNPLDVSRRTPKSDVITLQRHAIASNIEVQHV